jgi:hypothetical protein
MRPSKAFLAAAVSGLWLAASAFAVAGAPGQQARQRHPTQDSAPASRPAGQGQRAMPRSQAQPRQESPRQAEPAPGAQAPEASGRQRYPNNSSIGRAVPRTEPIQPPNSGRTYDVPGYYYPYAFTGLGLGYYYYDPFWRGYLSPYSYGPYGYDGYSGYSGYPGYDNSYAPAYTEPDEGDAAIHLKVKPNDASVYVDGYFVGTVDSYDGIFQKLHLQSGPHRIEIREPGYQPLSFDVNLQPGQTITYKGDLQQIR